jgi:hypothetical protein
MPTSTVMQKLTTSSTDMAMNFAAQAKTMTQLNAEVQEAVSEDKRRLHTMTETQEEKIPYIKHMLDVGIPSHAAYAIMQGVTQFLFPSQASACLNIIPCTNIYYPFMYVLYA